MTATAYEDVIEKAVKKGKGVKKEVLEEIKVEEELEKEHEVQKEVERRLREGDLAKLRYPHGDDTEHPITMVRNPEDEVYGNLPMELKVDISDAVNFIEATEGAKVGDMRAAFMESHLTNKVKDKYFDELRTRLEMAKREGKSQVVMPTPSQEMISEMTKEETKEGKGRNDDLAATLAPFFMLQKLTDEGGTAKTEEKPTEIVKSIMETAKEISETKGEQEKPTEVVKSIMETAKEMSTNQSNTPNTTELINAILSTVETLSQSKQPTPQQAPDILQQITAVSELVNTLSNKANEPNSTDKIQVPREDGSVMEMSVQQYLLSEMLRTKLVNTSQAVPVQKQEGETVKIQDSEGNIKTMSPATYISELAMDKMREEKEQTARRPSETERTSQDNTKLMAALVATVERLSSEMSQIKSQEGRKDDPINMLDTMLEESQRIENFRRRFLGGGLTDDDKKREQEEAEKQREHELQIAKMTAQQASRSTLANMLAGEGGPTPMNQPIPPEAPQPQHPEPTSEEYTKETIRRSQRKAEQMIEDLAREKALAERIAEEEAHRRKTKKRQKPVRQQTTEQTIRSDEGAEAEKKVKIEEEETKREVEVEKK